MDGQPAQITIAQEFIYPTDYQPAPAPVVGGGGQSTKVKQVLVEPFRFNPQFLSSILLLRTTNNQAFVRSESSWTDPEN